MSVNILAQSCDKGNAFSCYTAAELFSGGFDNFVFSDSLRHNFIQKACLKKKTYCQDARDLALKTELRCARFELHKRFNAELYKGLTFVDRYFDGACLDASPDSRVSYKELATIYDNGYLSVKDKRTSHVLQEAKKVAGTIRKRESKCRLHYLENTFVASVLFSRARIELGIEYLKKQHHATITIPCGVGERWVGVKSTMYS